MLMATDYPPEVSDLLLEPEVILANVLEVNEYLAAMQKSGEES
jgi:hypothetical protein